MSRRSVNFLTVVSLYLFSTVGLNMSLAAQSVTATHPAESRPFAIAFNPVTNQIDGLGGFRPAAATPNLANRQSPATGLSRLPADAQGPISAALGKDDSTYWVHAHGNDFYAENPQHALVMNFTKEGAQVRSPDARWGLATRAYGYGESLQAVSTSAPQTKANRVEYRRGSLTEWYANGPLGLEQGFTLTEPPGKANGQPLTVELALTSELVAVLEPDRTTLTLTRKDGQAALRYTGLTARDAAGRQLRSWLELKGERLLLRVDDSGARYPIVIDPWVQQAEFTASDGAAGDLFGVSVAVSGSTAVIGAPDHDQSQGAAYVFVQSGSTWSQQAEFTASDGAAGDEFGISVAVSGSTAVVGAFNHTVGSNSNQGAAYVFVPPRRRALPFFEVHGLVTGSQQVFTNVFASLGR